MCSFHFLARLMLGVGVVGQLAAVLTDPSVAGEARILKVIKSPGNFQLAPLINDRGDVVVFVNMPLDHPDHGVWMSSSDGTMQQMVRIDTALPEVPKGATLHIDPHSLQWNELGQLTWIGSWNVEGAVCQGIWQIDPESAPKSLVIWRSQPDATSPIPFHDQLNDVWDLTSQDRAAVCFKGTTYDREKVGKHPRLGFPRPNGKSEYWIWRDGSEPQLVRTMPGNHHETRVALNERGDLLEFQFGAPFPPVTLQLLDGPRLELLNSKATVHIGQNEFPILHIHSAVHRVDHGVTLLVSAGKRRPNVVALLQYDGNTWKPLLYDGPPVDGQSNHSIEMNSTVMMNREGSVLVFPHSRSEGKQPTITFIAKNQPPRTLVDTTRPAPGMDAPFAIPIDSSPEDAVERPNVRRFHDHSPPFSAIQFNDRNQIAFIGEVAGSDGAMRSGIWLCDARTGELRLVVRTGEKVTLPSGGAKAIKDLLMVDPDQDAPSASRALNVHGALTYMLVLEDDSIAMVMDDRFATTKPEEDAAPALPPNAVAEDDAEDDGEDLAERACDEWEQAADEYLEHLEVQWVESDQNKIEKLANELRAEYQDTQRRLAALLVAEGSAEMTPLEYGTTIKSLRNRLRELPVVWQALSEWPFHRSPSPPSPDQKVFVQKSLQLLRDYDLYPAVAERVLAKSQRINEIQQTAIKAAESIEEMSSFSQVFRASAFQESIGPLNPGLLPDRSGDSSPASEVKGPLGEVREPLSQLAYLQLSSDGRLNINRQSWLEAAGGTSLADAKKTALELLTRARISQGALLPSEGNEHRLEMHRARTMQASPEADLFMKIQEACSSHGGSRGHSGGGGSATYRFSNDKLAGNMMTTENGLFTLELSELVEPWRNVKLESHDGRLRIINASEDDIFVLTQATDGKIRCVVKSDEVEEVRGAKNFAELYRSDPEFVKKRIVDYLNALGMRAPVKPEGPAFRTAVIRRLQSSVPAVRKAAEEAIQALNSPEYERRQAAFVTLLKNAEIYQPILEEHLKNGLEVESRVQLERVIAFAAEQSGEYGILIKALGTLESASHLDEIRREAKGEERALIDLHLQRIKSSR